MISYDPLFTTMKQKGISEYTLIYKQGVSANTIYRIRHSMPITTKTIDLLCYLLACEVTDILAYHPDEE